MSGTTSSRPGRPGLPSVAEIAALTARLRRLSDAGARADDAEREVFLADKRDLLDRIAANERAADSRVATEGRAVDEQEWHPLGSARLDRPTTAAELDARRAAGWYGPDLTDERVARAEQAMAEFLARHGVDLTGDVREIEQNRREQLNQWAADQTTDTDRSAVDDHSRARSDDPTYDPEATP